MGTVHTQTHRPKASSRQGEQDGDDDLLTPILPLLIHHPIIGVDVPLGAEIAVSLRFAFYRVGR